MAVLEVWTFSSTLKTSGDYLKFRSQVGTVEKEGKKKWKHIYGVYKYWFIRFVVYTFKCQLFVFEGLFFLKK